MNSTDDRNLPSIENHGATIKDNDGDQIEEPIEFTVVNPDALKIPQAYYLIVDLEATCSDDESVPRHQMEIIEIGAVLLNAKSLQVESEFQTFVQPILYPTLTDFCRSLTSITQADVDTAPQFLEAMRSFQAWFQPFQDYLFCSWGAFDKTMFKRDCKLHRMYNPFKQHLNLKKVFSRSLGTRQRFSMEAALRIVDLPLEGTHHRGIDDARNLARIMQVLLMTNHQ